MRYNLWSLGIWSFGAIPTLTSATQLNSLGDLILGNNLETRELESRATEVECPNGYTAQNGMNFTTYCDQNNAYNDAYGPFSVNSMETCMEYCSRYWGLNEGCYGVVFNGDKNCWLRNSTTSTAGLANMTGTHSALVAPRSQLDSYDTDCPYTDQSVQTLDSGESFTIQCDKAINGFQTTWVEYQVLPDPKNSATGPFNNFWHTSSLKDCMDICATSHPLCQAVSWSPDMKVGYANCWPRTGWSGALNDPAWNEGTMHSATLQSVDASSINKTCPAETTNQNGKSWQVQCGQTNSGGSNGNITSVHRQNITSCMDDCANSDKGCVGILFDPTLTSGYMNCILQNTTLLTTSSPNVTYARLSGTSVPTSSNPSSSTSSNPDNSNNNNNNNNNNKSTSKAWVAGPVIGGIAAMGLLFGGLFLWRRRKAKNANSPPGYSAGGYPYGPPAEMGESVHPSEMGAANYGYSVPNHKYAHEVTSPIQEAPADHVSSAKTRPQSAQELPT